ncbi:DUF3726 domain-containing protein [Primorskyibacter sp. S187A]|uniref:DUF3726 domain-containing protein n=1 Tax=Primorskyibacter sp. S187A TaxID=3415130 RepID=UPI003C7DCA40
MSHSVNEIEALATKAARGAGAPPAQAAKFGQAAVRHLAASRAEAALIDALQALPGGPILQFALRPDRAHPLGQSYAEAQARAAMPARLAPSKALLDALAPLAHKTYVPASEASRTAGAGAGLTDND